MHFEYYVINYNINKNKAEMYNIFNNWILNDEVEKEIKKYLESPNDYTGVLRNKNKGFEALCEEIDSLIAWQERGHCEYEISAGYKFETDCKNLVAFGCYDQAHANIKMLVRDLMYQYKSDKVKFYKRNPFIFLEMYHNIKLRWYQRLAVLIDSKLKGRREDR